MRCINCGIAMQRLQRHLISSLSAHHQTRLSHWITNAQTKLPLDTFICHPCLLLLNTEAGEHERLLGHNMVCLGCGKSVRKIRHHNVSMECPLLAVLLSENTNYVVLNLERVCRASWEAASRAIKSQAVDSVNRPTVKSAPVIDNIADAVIPVPPPLSLPVPPPQVILPIKPRCINCWIALPITQKYHYNATHMDPEIIAILEEWIARQVIDEDCLCQECVSLLILELNNRNEGNIGERRFGHVSVCVCCGISISRRSGRLSRPLNYGNAEWIYCANKISPLEMPSNARACNACWQRAHQQPPPPLETGSVISTASTDKVDIQQDPNPFISGSSSVVEPPSCASTDIEIILREPVVGNTDICDDDDYADDDSDTLVESNVCRVCLAVDVKMYNLKDTELRDMFQNITGITVTEDSHSILESLCWECAGRLKAAAAFRNKALLTDALLQGLASTGEKIQKNDITLIKENKDYLKSARTLSVIEVFHSVDIDPENDGIPPLSENNDTEIVQNTMRKDSFKLKKESIIEKDDDQTDFEDELIIEAPIKTEMEYDQFDHICPPNTGEESSNAFIEINTLVSNYETLGDDKINSADSSPLPGCSHVEPKYPIFGYLKKASSDCEDKINKHVIITTKRDSISKLVSKNSKALISAKSKNINVKMVGVGKKTSNKKLLKKTEVKANTDEEIMSLEDFDF